MYRFSMFLLLCVASLVVATSANAVDCAPCGNDCYIFDAICQGGGGTELQWEAMCHSSCSPDKFKIYRYAHDLNCTFLAGYIGEVDWTGDDQVYTFTDTSNPNQCRSYKVQLYTASDQLLCSVIIYACGGCPCW